MPYENLKELPPLVRDELPPHAQEIYMEAFNAAWDQYAEPEERRALGERPPTRWPGRRSSATAWLSRATG